MDFGKYFSAYFSNWVGWMGGLGSIMLTVSGFFLPNKPRLLFLLAAFIIAVITPVRIWTLEHAARTSAEEARKPALSMRPMNLLGGMLGQNGKPFLIFSARLANTGAPSIAIFAPLVIIRPNGTRIIGEPAVTGESDFKINMGSYIFHGTPQTNLAIQVGSNPIPRGGGATGWLMHYFPTLSLADLQDPNNIVQLDYFDVLDQRQTATANLQDATLGR